MRKRDSLVPQERFKFWDSLLEKSDKKTKLFERIKVVSKKNGIPAGIGKVGISLRYCGSDNETWVELNINIGDHKKETETVNIYEGWLAKRGDIDKKYPELNIEWNPVKKNTINSKVILSYSDKGGIGDTAKWNEIQDDLVERMIKFEKIFKDGIHDFNGFGGSTHPVSNPTILKRYLPKIHDVDHAEEQRRKTSSDEVIGMDAVLDQLEDDFKKAGKPLKENWREITKQNIKIWFSKK